VSLSCKAKPEREGSTLTANTCVHIRTRQEMVALDRLAPQTWCVLGNCFSLQREFETAVKFFHRAIQVDATFTYAYTLAGHEHVSNEDFDKATASFRDALRYDQRHYNAWCPPCPRHACCRATPTADVHLLRVDASRARA